MKLLTAFALLLAVPALAQTPPPATAPVYELAFTAQPDGTPDMASWTGHQTEGTIKHSNVQGGLARGDDTVLNGLVEQKICDPKAEACSFRIRYAFRDADRTNDQSTLAVRYVIRGADGTLIEGYMLSPSREPSVYRFWDKANGSWTEYTAPAAFEKQKRFVLTLLMLVSAMEAKGVLTFTE